MLRDRRGDAIGPLSSVVLKQVRQVRDPTMALDISCPANHWRLKIRGHELGSKVDEAERVLRSWLPDARGTSTPSQNAGHS